MLVWASIYNQYGEQGGVTLEIDGKDVYSEIKGQLAPDEDVADYGIYEEE